MKTITCITLSIAAAILLPGCASRVPQPAARDTRCFELRTYYAAPDKLDALNARFRNHTCKLFAKHGMQNLGYWMPVENPDRKLVYLLAYPSREARDASWKAFMADPEWKQAAQASEVNGKLVSKAESLFLTATDYSPAIRAHATTPPRVFELRTYQAVPERFDALNARFREHTVTLFARHGITQYGYWNLAPGQPGADRTLVYLLAHKSQEAAAASFKAFRADPDWIAAKEASEKKAGGSLTVSGPDGVKSEFMVPTDYSPTK